VWVAKCARLWSAPIATQLHIEDFSKKLKMEMHSLVQTHATVFRSASVEHLSYQQCHHPLHFWFWMACFLVIGFGVAFSVGRRAESGANCWFIDPQNWIAKAAFTSTWAVLLPLLLGWTAIGMSWLSDTLNHTPDCFPADQHFSPLVFASLQVICAMGVVIYAVFVANVWDAVRNRRANAVAISAVEDADLVARWGQMKPSATMEFCGGLMPSQFGDLPIHELASDGGACVICLQDMMEGEYGRSLPNCGHVFHRACIDLWLLRRTSCPLCNADVQPCTGQLMPTQMRKPLSQV
jgi:hypothetical protein